MIAAARFGLTFRCNPLDVLDRDEADQYMVLALARAAQRDIDASNNSAKG